MCVCYQLRMPESYYDILTPVYHPAFVTIQECLPAAMCINLEIKTEKVISIEIEMCSINFIMMKNRKCLNYY